VVFHHGPGGAKQQHLGVSKWAWARVLRRRARRFALAVRCGRSSDAKGILLSAMIGFAERMFQLGLESLAEQERQVAEVRTRGSTLLAAGAVIASLLVKPVFRENNSHDALETFAAIVGLLGAGGLLVFVVMLLRPYELGFTINAPATYHALWDDGILGQPMMDLALADAFEKRREMNSGIVGRLSLFLGLALGALVLETAGLAAAAALGS
jgi:hypothetical protein